MFIAELLLRAKMWKQLKCPCTDEQRNKMWYIHKIEQYLAIERNEVLVHVTAWKNLENFMPVKETRHKRPYII